MSGMERVVKHLGCEMNDKRKRQKFEEIGTELGIQTETSGG